MTSDQTAMTIEQVRLYKEAVAALVAASLNRVRAYPLELKAEPATVGARHD
jgi:hypothetical protein